MTQPSVISVEDNLLLGANNYVYTVSMHTDALGLHVRAEVDNGNIYHHYIAENLSDSAKRRLKHRYYAYFDKNCEFLEGLACYCRHV